MSETITNPFVGQVVLYQGEPYQIVRVDGDVCYLSNVWLRVGQGIKRAKVHYTELDTPVSAGKPLPGDQIVIRDGSQYDGEMGMILPGGDHGYFKVAVSGSGIDVHHMRVEAVEDDAPEDLKMQIMRIINGELEDLQVMEIVNGELIDVTPAAPMTLTTREEMDIRVAAYSATNAPDELATLRAALVQIAEREWEPRNAVFVALAMRDAARKALKGKSE